MTARALPACFTPSCWCGEAATYAAHVDPAVSTSNVTVNGDPCALTCSEHVGWLGGVELVELDAPGLLLVDYDDRPWWGAKLAGSVTW